MREEHKHFQHEDASSGGYLRDVIYGANDGIITTFAVVAGVAGAALSSSVVLILGFANLIADGISMGMSNYLGLKSQRDFESRERQREEQETEMWPEEERDEIRRMYAAKGFAGQDLERAVAIITSDKKRWVDEMMVGEFSVVTGSEETPWKHGLITFGAFVVAGILPLIPYVVLAANGRNFAVSIASTASTLFLVGSLRSRYTKHGWFVSGFEMLGVGAIAATAAYAVGALVSRFL